MKLAFISGVKFGYDLLSEILKAGWLVDVVFSYADSKKLIYSDFASFEQITRDHRIKHVKVNNINDEENIALLRERKPDLILVMGWSQILKSEILRIPKLGVIGSHPTELPKFRGRAPVPWTIIKGLKESALTFFYMEEGIDDGDILDQRKFKITEEDDATSIYEKITTTGKNMILENLPAIENGTTKRIKQDESKFIEYWPKRTPDDGRINWTKPGKEIHDLIRATTHPYPGAFSSYRKSILKIWKSQFLQELNKEPGKIMGITNNGVKIGTGNGVVLIKKASLENDKEIDAVHIFSNDDIGKVLG